MKKNELNRKVDINMNETKSALELLWANINKGQQKQILKDEKIVELFDRYSVEY